MSNVPLSRGYFQSALAPSLAYLYGLRRWGRLLSLGVVEQAIYSGTNFCFAVVLANAIGTRAFGEYNIAWSVVMLCECVLYSLFGDAVPAIANRLPPPRWRELRGAVYLWSTLFSGAVAAIALVASLALAFTNPGLALLVAVSGVTVYTMRAQQMCRRICYLDGTRALAVAGAAMFSITIFAAFVLVRWSGIRTGVAGMICLMLGCAASGGVMLWRRRDFRMPGKRLLVWSWHKLWRSGRWLTAASISYWAANSGLIPVAGAFFGREAGGALRIVQTLTNPLSQLTAVIFSIVLPPAAEKLRVPTRQVFMRVSYRSLVLFAAISGAYAVALTLWGTPLVHLLFHSRLAAITTAVLAVASIAAALDAITSAITVPLLATNHTSVMLVGRLVSLVVLCLVLPFALHLPGLIGFVAVTAVSNLAQTGVLAYCQARQVGRLRAGG